MDTLNEYVVYDWDETYAEAAHKHVVDSLPELFKDDPTTLSKILEVTQIN